MSIESPITNTTLKIPFCKHLGKVDTEEATGPLCHITQTSPQLIQKLKTPDKPLALSWAGVQHPGESCRKYPTEQLFFNGKGNAGTRKRTREHMAAHSEKTSLKSHKGKALRG